MPKATREACSCSDHLTTTILPIVTTNIHVRESPASIKRMHEGSLLHTTIKFICKDSLTDVLRVFSVLWCKMTEEDCIHIKHLLSGRLIQLPGYNSHNGKPQLDCNQGNHSVVKTICLWSIAYIYCASAPSLHKRQSIRELQFSYTSPWGDE